MSYLIILTLVICYFLVLISISFVTSKNVGENAFFTGDKSSPWYVVAFGMIGASLSGVTFISIPAWVEKSHFSYMQMVFGYLLGYFIIAKILLPLYYRLQLTSIYVYLKGRFGNYSYKTGAAFFLISRVIGAAYRLFLVAFVLEMAVFNQLFSSFGIQNSQLFNNVSLHFVLTTGITIALIWVYTFKSGIKTVVWTDTLQTFFMITAVIVTIFIIKDELGLSFVDLIDTIKTSKYSKVFFFSDYKSGMFFPKKFIAGVFMAIVMTGLDQDMMQKNLSCRNLKDAQKNMYWFSIVLVFVNLIFLCLGSLLFIYAKQLAIPLLTQSDALYPTIALNYLGDFGGVVFVLGVIAAAYSSADSALTSLTTSFCIDILDKPNLSKKKRYIVHLAFSVLLLMVILVFKLIDDKSIVNQLFKFAGYTYGPLLGLYSFGLFTKYKVVDIYAPIVCICAPIISFITFYYSKVWWDYEIGFELLLINGFITFLGLLIISKHSGENTLLDS